MAEAAQDVKADVLVLGGSGHLGAAVVRALVNEGARVRFTWHANEDAARTLEAQSGARALQWSAGDDAAVLVDGQPLTALVQCIGTAGDEHVLAHTDGLEKFLAIDAADWQRMHDVTVTSTFAACQAMAPRMARPGNIVVVGSIDGVKSVPAPVHYAAGKGALSAMVRALAKALGGQGVCVNMIAAGILDGGLGALLEDTLRAQYLKHCGLKRLGRADEVAALAAWLALRNTYVSGQSIVLDGGL